MRRAHIFGYFMAFAAVVWLARSDTWAAAGHYPVIVQSCGQNVVIPQRPRCAVFHDVNMAEMGFALHLQHDMCGVTGISGWNKATPAFRRAQGRIPELAPRYPTLETLLQHHADLYVAGWNYGMTVGGRVTPEHLARFHIPVVALSESCLRAPGSTHPPVTLEALLFDDLYRLGRVFDRENAARDLIASYRRRLNAVKARLQGRSPVRVFLYDSGRAAPLTAGGDALATRMIELSGGRNIMDDLPTNWGGTSWETVAKRQPEAMIIVDYGSGTQAARANLKARRFFMTIPAVRNSRLISIPYDALTPGPADIDAIERLSKFLHPEAYR